MEALPQRPQLELAKTWRVSWSKSTSTAGARKMFSVFSGTEDSRHGAISRMSGRAHGHGHATAADANLQRFLAGQGVGLGLGPVAQAVEQDLRGDDRGP